MEKDLTETLDKEFIDEGFTLIDSGIGYRNLILKFKGTKIVWAFDGDTLPISRMVTPG